MKTNHRRQYVENVGERSEYITMELHEVAVDGEVVSAYAKGPKADSVCGKHVAAKDRAGAKKFVHSRIRRRTRDWLNKLDITEEV
jgi:hypothetical protein